MRAFSFPWICAHFGTPQTSKPHGASFWHFHFCQCKRTRFHFGAYFRPQLWVLARLMNSKMVCSSGERSCGGCNLSGGKAVAEAVRVIYNHYFYYSGVLDPCFRKLSALCIKITPFFCMLHLHRSFPMHYNWHLSEVILHRGRKYISIPWSFFRITPNRKIILIRLISACACL